MRVTTCTNLRIHFVHRHMGDTLVIKEECKHPHPRCPACDMFVTWVALKHCHPNLWFLDLGSDPAHKKTTEGLQPQYGVGVLGKQPKS